MIVASAFGLRGQGSPQGAEEPASPLKITGITLESASLPGSSLVWTKIVINFSNAEGWADGVMFSVQALLESGGRKRVASGVVRYANVQQGNHRAVMYLSPRATLRYGKPEAVKVDMLYKDEEAGQFEWRLRPGGPQINWRDYSVYNGVLVNVLNTPWLLQDFERSPDVIASN